MKLTTVEKVNEEQLFLVSQQYNFYCFHYLMF